MTQTLYIYIRGERVRMINMRMKVALEATSRYRTGYDT